MKLIIHLLITAFIVTSCGREKKAGISSTVNNQLITIRNGNITFSVDNNIQFKICYQKESKNILLTAQQDNGPSIGIIDSAGNRVSFTRKAARQLKINDKHGEGEATEIEAESSDRSISAKITLTAYNQFPDVMLVQASFRNNSGVAYCIHGYFLNQIIVPPGEDEPAWWSFQGASYNWGQDFVFQLPDSFSRDNYMGMNGIKAGGGIPMVDTWNKDFGIAIASLSNRPENISLPVAAENGTIHLKAEKHYTNQILLPGDSILTVQTAVIVHQGDFYNPLRTFSRLMKPLLPGFQEPVDFAYQPEWCTWGYNQHFKPGDIISKLDTLTALGIKSVILDDGWSLNHGDWIPDPGKFPAGDADFKTLIKALHDKGFKVWLWWVPGYADSLSSVVSGNPEWLVLNEDGSVHPSFGLCPAYAPVQEHYKNLVRKFVEDYRLDGFKLDFGEINSAPPCFNPLHHHRDPYESYRSTPVLFQNICLTAKSYNPQMLIEYCSCGIPPNIFHLPFANLAVTSDPDISQITSRIKMYKALMGDDFPVLEEYCGVLAGPTYQLVTGTGGVPGTFSTFLDEYHVRWMDIYRKYELSRGQYLNLYDIGFDYPEAHVIKKDDRFYYGFYTHPWKQLESPRCFRFGKEFDHRNEGKNEFNFPEEDFSGNIELRGLDPKMKYRIVDYENNREIGIVPGREPFLEVSFTNYLLLEATPVNF